MSSGSEDRGAQEEAAADRPPADLAADLDAAVREREYLRAARSAAEAELYAARSTIAFLQAEPGKAAALRARIRALESRVAALEASTSFRLGHAIVRAAKFPARAARVADPAGPPGREAATDPAGRGNRGGGRPGGGGPGGGPALCGHRPERDRRLVGLALLHGLASWRGIAG